MDLADKLELCKGYRAIRTMARFDNDGDLVRTLNEMEFDKLLEMEANYNFFKRLHKQTKLDNVISMMKIFGNLEVELPNIRIDTMNIDKTCDELWESINEQIPISDTNRDNLIALMKDIVDDDDINHPNTKRKLNDVLRNLNEIEDDDRIGDFIENYHSYWDYGNIRIEPSNYGFGHYIVRDW